MAPGHPLRCPRCERELELDDADVEGRRARCERCGTGMDVLQLRSPDHGPMRTFDQLQLVPDEIPPPAYMDDRSGGGRTRHVRLWPIRQPTGLTRITVATGVLAAAIIFLLIVAIGGVGPVGWVFQGLAVLAAVEMFRREATALDGREDIWLRGGRLYRRRSALGVGWSRSVRIDRVSDVELSAGIGTGPFLEVRLLNGRRLRLAEDFSQGEAALSWLRDHLRAGIATVRDDRGLRGHGDGGGRRLQDDGSTARAQLSTSLAAKEK
jgi:hypothetical protein